MSKTILIVDGSPVMRRVVERSLRLAGLEAQQVYEAGDGKEALSLAQQHQPDLILTDLNLAGMDGMELLRQLREAEATRAVPVVIVTSQAGEAHVLEALELGAQGYIRKPFTADQVRDYIAPLFH
ncbi:MAG TPA: response regulator [Terriglobales bacterium]|nr:response regulator [Terriglobales bacterium]